MVTQSQINRTQELINGTPVGDQRTLMLLFTILDNQKEKYLEEK
ncbi:hypothetical protein OXT66_08045 [Lentilactobacillus senioris]|nr:hypothetical protein [Lentilactobacillus senioris]MCY9807484.1 hypothetical protein [Lentilactobacillus senioris]